jgi:hypothetical protein
MAGWGRAKIIISIDAEKAFDKSNTLIWKETLSKQAPKGTSSN